MNPTQPHVRRHIRAIAGFARTRDDASRIVRHHPSTERTEKNAAQPCEVVSALARQVSTILCDWVTRERRELLRHGVE
jgi:hypothetical protein